MQRAWVSEKLVLGYQTNGNERRNPTRALERKKGARDQRYKDVIKIPNLKALLTFNGGHLWD